MNIFRKRRRKGPTPLILKYPKLATRAILTVYHSVEHDKWGLGILFEGSDLEEFLPCQTRAGAEQVGRIMGRTIEKAGGLAELTIMRRKGIASKDTYGDDPRDIPG